MKLRTFLASVSACAIAVSAMAITASAEVTNGNATGDNGSKFYNYDLLAEGKDATAVYGVKIELTIEDLSEGCGGGMGFNSDSTGWKSIEWGNADSGKTIILDANNDLTYQSTTPIFAADDTYCQIWIQNWWGDDVTVDGIVLLDASGNEIGAPAQTDAPAQPGAPAGTTAAGGTATGDAGIALAVAGLAVAGAAAYVARKKD